MAIAEHSIVTTKPLDEHTSEECFYLGYATCIHLLDELPSILKENQENATEETDALIRKVSSLILLIKGTLSLDKNNFTFEVKTND